MKIRTIVIFLAAVAVSATAAGFRWGGSGHVIGTIHANGGSVNHPLVLAGDHWLYSFIVTASVIPPYSGDVEIVLAGEPALDYDIFLAEPVVDLGLYPRPDYSAPILSGLHPGDRISLWTVVKTSQPVRGKYQLEFLDTRSRTCVLSIPIIFAEERGDNEGHT